MPTSSLSPTISPSSSPKTNRLTLLLLSALPLNGSTVDEVRKGLIGKIGENISIRRFQIIEGKGKLSTYIHGGAKIGVIVDVVGGNDEVAHDVAMHIAASKPKALDKDGVDQNLIETERRVAIEKARENGKPEHLIEKIAEGSVNKFLKEVTLLSQPFVKDDSKSVGRTPEEQWCYSICICAVCCR